MRERGIEVSNPAEKEKPEFLYHASPNKEIELFEPKAESIRDPREGSVVFGISDKEFTTVYLVKTDDSWTRKGKFNGVPYIVISDRKRFEEADKGGAMYVLPSDSFEQPLGQGMDEEWVSKTPVAPVEKETYESALEAMLEQGIQVFFVDRHIFEKIDQSDDHGLSILQNISSENQLTGINVKSIRNNERSK